ncbi:hypothetical protein [Streptomyces rishiriensis]|uniref:Uncharacterized protein n=1 Tax=Streptomyces rishiriensis TaxID=68264 RepID=A0ABU0NHG5_STRRH|nr:hypothetical protein [Streptomyces rishiriensis]MDQ0578553.1 hypothetical protein [Streptomyces rishiriensis]
MIKKLPRIAAVLALSMLPLTTPATAAIAAHTLRTRLAADDSH